MPPARSVGHPLEAVLPGLQVVSSHDLGGAARQSSLARVSVRLPDGRPSELVVRSPQAGALGMDTTEDCARRVMALYRTRGLPHCAPVHAVWGVDTDGHIIDLANVQSWYVAETAVAGVPLSTLLGSAPAGEDLVAVFERLGRQLARIHAIPERPVGLSPSRGVHEALAGPEGALPILAGYPTRELRAHDPLVADYVALAARLAWRLESIEGRPTTSCHGDLHPGNILVENGRLAFIDRSRTETCEPASDVASVLVNLIRIGFESRGHPIDPALLAETFVTSYGFGSQESWVRPLGYYLLTRMPAALAPAFNPAVDPVTRWRTLGWIHDLMAGQPPETAAGWLAAIRTSNTS